MTLFLLYKKLLFSLLSNWFVTVKQLSPSGSVKSATLDMYPDASHLGIYYHYSPPLQEIIAYYSSMSLVVLQTFWSGEIWSTPVYCSYFLRYLKIFMVDDVRLKLPCLPFWGAEQEIPQRSWGHFCCDDNICWWQWNSKSWLMELMVLIHYAQENWCWLTYDPWLTIIASNGIIVIAALFWGPRNEDLILYQCPKSESLSLSTHYGGDTKHQFLKVETVSC